MAQLTLIPHSNDEAAVKIDCPEGECLYWNNRIFQVLVREVFGINSSEPLRAANLKPFWVLGLSGLKGATNGK